MPKFFDDLKGKAQSAINATPLAAYVPGHEHHGGAQAGSSQPSQGGGRSHALGAIQHQLRSLQVQYGSATSKDLRQVQLVITGQKGVVLDLEKEGQDLKAVSKEFYIWGQSEDSDVKDVSDRLAYLTYVQGSLAANLASSLDASRAPFKALRDAESHLQPKRNLRAGYELQISRMKNEGRPGAEPKLKEVEALLKKAEMDDEPLEREVELLKRKAIVESETQKWQALREYGEKLVMLSQACTQLVGVLPSVPPTAIHPYGGAKSTAATRAALQKALDNYKPGNITLPVPSGADHEPRSFGETHASELSRISSVADRHNFTPGTSSPGPTQSAPDHGPTPQPTAAHQTGTVPVTGTYPSVPVQPSELNNAPAPIPSSAPGQTPATATTPLSSGLLSGSMSAPTFAETGVPIAAGAQGPGPVSGSLAGGNNTSGTSGPIPVGGTDTSGTSGISPASGTVSGTTGPGYGEAVPSYGGTTAPTYGLSDSGAPASAKYESAEDEKKRLERESRERTLQGNTPLNSAQSPPSNTASSTTPESAEEEKKRLEREERERILHAGSNPLGGGPPAPGPDGGDGSVPPPYTEPR